MEGVLTSNKMTNFFNASPPLSTNHMNPRPNNWTLPTPLEVPEQPEQPHEGLNKTTGTSTLYDIAQPYVGSRCGYGRFNNVLPTMELCLLLTRSSIDHHL